MPATITDPKKLFLHELGDVLTAERMLTTMLPTMENKASDEKLAARLREHLNETRKHVENVNQVFTLLGETPSSVPCPAMEGIKTEQQESEGEASTPRIGRPPRRRHPRPMGWRCVCEAHPATGASISISSRHAPVSLPRDSANSLNDSRSPFTAVAIGSDRAAGRFLLALGLVVHLLAH